MTALADPPALNNDVILDWMQRLAELNRRLEPVKPVSTELVGEIRSTIDNLNDLPEEGVDPYLLLSIRDAELLAAKATWIDDESARRRQLRVAVEQLRQVFRDIAEGLVVSEARSGKEIATWLSDNINVPQTAWADLLRVTPRTFQRWISPNEATRPQGEDEERLRLIALIVRNLRHALTGPGVIRWFQLPREELQGSTPLELLMSPDQFPKLLTFASRARSSSAG